MNNLLRTLTESQVKNAAHNTDLKLLLTSVKEYRRAQQNHDTKLADPFYDSLEGLLLDLKTVSIDNHDAEAFLKPVLKAEVPDYYEIISNPMDFQTMLKKVKQRQYKSKKEFKDDLDLIWSNCFTYNASPNHPLQKCAKRLKVKAEKLLANITDRKERTDPPIPPELSSSSASASSSRIKLNGHVLTNGRSHTRSPSMTKTSVTSSKVSTPTPGKAIVKIPRRDVSFPESSAIVRTPEGMALFRELDRSFEAGPSTQVIDRLRQLAPHVEYEPDPEPIDVEVKEEMDDSAVLGDKRKVSSPITERPLKRARLNANGASSSSPSPAYDKALPLWWGAAQSDFMLANGLPEIPSSSSYSHRKPHPFQQPQPIRSIPSNTKTEPTASASLGSSSIPSFSHTTTSQPRQLHSSIPPNHSNQPTKRKKRRKKPYEEIDPYRAEDHPKALLTLMNNNIRTIKRVRHTHAKFAALGLTKDGGGGGEDDGDNNQANAGPSTVNPLMSAPGAASGGGGLGSVVSGGAPALANMEVDDVMDDQIDDRPWKVPTRRGRKVSGMEIGSKNAEDCLQWANGKVLEHAGFQGTSRAALDVLCGVTSDYLLNVGRTIRFLCDKFSNTMTAEEIILHTLFESGTSRIQDLERYISDDVERYGSRLGDLEKKIIGAYREATAVETLEDEGLFEEEDEEEASALALGEFGDNIGLDYFGLKELGIADEFGLSSLTIPKRLLKGKKRRNVENSPAAKPSEPPLPFPPPPPLIPLTSDRIPDQIGLLQSLYNDKLKALAPPPPPLPPTNQVSYGGGIPALTGPSIPGLSGPAIPPLSGPTLTMPPPLTGPQIHPIPTAPTPGQQPAAAVPSQSIPSSYSTSATSSVTSIATLSAPPPAPPRDLIIPDDAPTPAQAKMGPLGQIVKTNPSQATTKKKAKGTATATGTGTGPGGPGGGLGSATSSPTKPPVMNGLVSIGGMVPAGMPPPGVIGMSGAGTEAAAGAATPVDGGTKKKKGVTGVGSGNGRKRKLMEGQVQGGQQSPAQGQGFGQGSGSGQNGQGPPSRSSFPPAVTAST
ncbi:hypothetical protein K435DRAFT_831483 [Dendrothele bispora CBS 962.96]|uniref:Bromo domain-containing protein n=1 Tax=Dendrothele bispora (strain CBS 962.96) TaxID=1314807 RepID=A0A4S8L5X7_DENBC|nr:hypothetical protein K435DRAFT_831483 [Dendrothele bispora CBS 962.96]